MRYENLVARCQTHEWNRIAFIGVTKHAGKTTALNGFITGAVEANLVLGLCSIGLDGERLDTILGVEKPAIYAPAGSFVVSAERALTQSEAKLEWMEQLPIESPLGSVMLARVTSPGKVVLAGVRQRAHVQQAVPRMQALGAQLCLVDGAFDRVAAAAPHLVDAAVLAVGAAAGKTISEVLTNAYPLIQRFCLPVYPEAHRAPLNFAQEEGQIALVTEFSVKTLPSHEALYGLASHATWTEDVHTVYLPGALTDDVLERLRGHGRSLQVVVSHPAQILLKGETYRRWFRDGHQLYVWHPMPLVGIAANPHSISGYDLPRQDLQDVLREVAPDVPVYDALDDWGTLHG